MDFFGDFCLSCDRQTNGTTFCSRACRLAELDQFTASSEPSSPARYDSYMSQSYKKSSQSTSLGFYLPPAIDFSMYRVSSNHSISTSLTSRSSSPKLSEQARIDLNNYVGAFDQTRTLKRRVSIQSNEESKSTTA